MTARPHRRQVLLRLATVALSFAVMFVLFEVGFRVKAVYDDRELDAFERLGSEPLVTDPNTKVKTKNIIRLSANPRIVYELVPGVNANYKRAIITINGEGRRGPELPLERVPGTVRVVGIGDSVMFGYGVGDRDYYLYVLTERLNARGDVAAWEFVNGAVPGYNTTMEIETLKEKLLAYQPDLVVIHYVSNDLDLPNFIRKRSAYFTLTRSYLWKYIYSIKKGWTRTPDERLETPRDADEIPELYQEMVGIDAYRRAMTELRRLGDSHGFEVVVVCTQRLPGEIRSIVTELGFPIVEAYDANEAHLRARGQTMDHYYQSELVVSDTDAHPSPLGHQILAGLLIEYLETSGLLPRLVSESRRQQASAGAEAERTLSR